MRFSDRHEAGRRLAERLLPLVDERPLVLGLPRGGVPVAAEVAERLDAPLDVLVVRKLGCPWQPELALGALAEGGTRLVDADLVRRTGVSEADLATVIQREQRELDQRLQRYRSGRPPRSVEGRTVVVVDDGLATGSTARAALQTLRHRGAGRLVLAVPVAPRDTLAAMRGLVDEVVCLHAPEDFRAVGAHYEDFSPTSESEVTSLLAAAARREQAGTSPDPAQPEGDAAGVTAPSVIEVAVTLDGLELPGTLLLPAAPRGIVVFAHGSGSSRHSPRNVAVARLLADAGLAALLFDLLDGSEALDRRRVFDIPLLGDRLVGAIRWVRARPGLGGLQVGCFGASTGAAAALWAAAELPDVVAAVVSRGGRPDLAAPRLGDVVAPTLLIVGARDEDVLQHNRRARRELGGPCELVVVPGATHLFEEPGALESVGRRARRWFVDHLVQSATPDASGRGPEGRC